VSIKKTVNKIAPGHPHFPTTTHFYYQPPVKTLTEAYPHELIEELLKRSEIEILESFGPCDGAFEVVEVIRVLREVMTAYNG
jgi:hypothetical protein